MSVIDTSRWYQEGKTAAEVDNTYQNAERTHCPYSLQSPKWFLWTQGYEDAHQTEV